MENQKLVESKAALCCGFAIALRALFLGILSYSPSLAEGGRGWVVMLRRSRNILSLRASVRTRGNQQARNPRIMKDSMPLDCFASLAMTQYCAPMFNINKTSSCAANLTNSPSTKASAAVSCRAIAACLEKCSMYQRQKYPRPFL